MTQEGYKPTAQLYSIQTPAFASASDYNPVKTDSTPDTPPSFTPVDIQGALKKKREVIANLPTQCGHCGTPFPTERNCIEEAGSNKDIIAYCRGQGGCGRSQVLYVTPDLKIPKYKKSHHYEAGPLENEPPAVGAKCKTCGQYWHAHSRNVDSNGWDLTGYDTVSLPKDWPVWDKATGKWKENNSFLSNFF